MSKTPYFTLEENRSERAKQTKCLVPALDDPDTRFELLGSINANLESRISRKESDHAKIMHFVWVLRDSFSYHRREVEKNRQWDTLRADWVRILELPSWARASDWWRHPQGEYKGEQHYVVHPCSRTVGWSRSALVDRANKFELDTKSGVRIDKLISAREVMNTECDCFIQTPKRLLVVECKDKTGFIEEQRDRQHRLFKCLERLLPRENPLVYVELSSEKTSKENGIQWTWAQVAELTGAKDCA